MQIASHTSSPILTTFYALNGVVALLVIVLGGAVFVGRWQAHGPDLFAPVIPRARQTLLRGLAALWILDGVLQAQPRLATQFVNDVLVPLQVGQPKSVDLLLRLGEHWWSLAPWAWDLAATWMQIGIGIAILVGREDSGCRWALWASIGWGLVIWTFGEGFGSLFSGAGWLTGAPGSAFGYVIAAGCLLLPTEAWRTPKFVRTWRRVIAGGWFLAAVLQMWPADGWWSQRQLATLIRSQAHMAQPGLTSAPLYVWGRSVAANPRSWNAVVSGVFVLMAILWARREPSPAAWWATVLVTIATWWLGQDFGVLGGVGTDPNTGAVVLVALLAYRQLVNGVSVSALTDGRRAPRQPEARGRSPGADP
jgi:hypothetical protein